MVAAHPCVISASGCVGAAGSFHGSTLSACVLKALIVLPELDMDHYLAAASWLCAPNWHQPPLVKRANRRLTHLALAHVHT